MKNKVTLLLVCLTMILTNQRAYSKPNILVTITPIASLVAMLTKDKADIIILDTSGGCPHHHSAKPSDKSLIFFFSLASESEVIVVTFARIVVT